jgi:hypothetical protein
VTTTSESSPEALLDADVAVCASAEPHQLNVSALSVTAETLNQNSWNFMDSPLALQVRSNGARFWILTLTADTVNVHSCDSEYKIACAPFDASHQIVSILSIAWQLPDCRRSGDHQSGDHFSMGEVSRRDP